MIITDLNIGDFVRDQWGVSKSIEIEPQDAITGNKTFTFVDDRDIKWYFSTTGHIVEVNWLSKIELTYVEKLLLGFE